MSEESVKLRKEITVQELLALLALMERGATDRNLYYKCIQARLCIEELTEIIAKEREDE